MDNKILTFSSELTADTATRVISGKIVPMGTGEVGNTSAGPVVFEKGSIQLPNDPKSIKLLNQHNVKEPLGKAQYFNEVDGEGIYASFKISNSSRGSDALITASEGLTAGLSVGVEVITAKNKAGVMHVSSAKLFEVSLVTEPAFKSALITDIAASEEVVEIQPTESEPTVENTPETVAAPEVEAAAVEAARPTVVTATYATPRIKPLTAGEYLEASIKASLGDDQARQTILAINDTSTNTGLTLAPHLNEFITTSIDGRPAVDAISKGVLPATGMSFTIPKISTAPTIDGSSTEGEALGGTEMASEYITPTVKKAAGLQNISWELLDRSGPSFYAELVKELQYAYAKATDQAVVAALVAGGTQATTQAATIAGFKAYIAKETPAAYLAAGKFAKNIIANTAWWEAIISAEDTTNRPLFTAAQPMNSPGNVGVQSLTGTVMGQNLYVDPHMTTTTLIDDSAFLVVPEAVTFYESPQTQIQVQALANGRLQVAVYGYYAIATKVGAGVRRFNLT
jgi:HK97 family phage major capsid protein